MNKLAKIQKLYSLMVPGGMQAQAKRMHDDMIVNLRVKLGNELSEEELNQLAVAGQAQVVEAISMIMTATFEIYDALLDESEIDELIEIYSRPVMAKLFDANATLAGRTLNIAQDQVIQQFRSADDFGQE